MTHVANEAANGKTTVTVQASENGDGRIDVNGANGQHLNAWQTPGPAAFDFRSDTSTTPTASMLASLSTTTLLDDVLHADPTTNALEARCAQLLGHEAGILVLSGTMGNQLAARTHLAAPPHGLLADHRAHILTHEAGGTSALSGAHPQPVTPAANGAHLTLADVQAVAELPSDDFHLCPTRLVSLENTLGGAILPLADAAAITSWARGHGIATHLDGARLWEAVAAQVARGEHGGSLEAGLRAYGELFDSVTVCFSKGLGAPLGSVLVGGAGWVRRARHARKMLGGGMRMTGVIAAPAMVGVEETFFGGRLGRSHELAKRVKSLWEGLGGSVVGEVETNMVWLDLSGAGVPQGVFGEEAAKEGLSVYESRVARIVCHYQISDEAVETLGRVLERAWARRAEGGETWTTKSGKKTGFRYGSGLTKEDEKKKIEQELEGVDCA